MIPLQQSISNYKSFSDNEISSSSTSLIHDQSSPIDSRRNFVEQPELTRGQVILPTDSKRNIEKQPESPRANLSDNSNRNSVSYLNYDDDNKNIVSYLNYNQSPNSNQNKTENRKSINVSVAIPQHRKNPVERRRPPSSSIENSNEKSISNQSSNESLVIDSSFADVLDRIENSDDDTPKRSTSKNSKNSLDPSIKRNESIKTIPASLSKTNSMRKENPNTSNNSPISSSKMERTSTNSLSTKRLTQLSNSSNNTITNIPNNEQFQDDINRRGTVIAPKQKDQAFITPTDINDLHPLPLSSSNLIAPFNKKKPIDDENDDKNVEDLNESPSTPSSQPRSNYKGHYSGILNRNQSIDKTSIKSGNNNEGPKLRISKSSFNNINENQLKENSNDTLKNNNNNNNNDIDSDRRRTLDPQAIDRSNPLKIQTSFDSSKENVNLLSSSNVNSKDSLITAGSKIIDDDDDDDDGVSSLDPKVINSREKEKKLSNDDDKLKIDTRRENDGRKSQTIDSIYDYYRSSQGSL